ncbi:MAG: hypothetical protein CVU84_14865 [Firmicutes bacterium HGW-Firmicutes-1]|jgi:uncharacterized protein (DUF58 family)|nr:MAG: hypothetical protein CVU84_14865 [Firmicutes bacterium HGW-Firmicutes-1]
MQPTKRLIFLAALGVIFTGLGALIYLHIFIFFFYNIMLLALILVDYRITKESFEIVRDYDPKLSLFAEEEMGFVVYNKSKYPLALRIKDTIPDFAFELVTDYAIGKVMPHEKERIFYTLNPKKRGIYSFTEIYVAYLSRLKLINKHVVYEMKADIKVYPNIKDLKKYRLMVFGGYIMRGGKKIWNKRGEGMEFESLREYIYGDAYSKINWKATASMNKPIINQFEIEKNQDVIALIDSGRAMSYEVRGYKKLDLAINTALILSDIANSSGDKSGLMVFNTEVQQYVKPATGGQHRNKLLEALYTIDYSRETSNFGEAFTYLTHQHKKRSLIFMFTEFETLDEANEYMKVLPEISKRHLVILFMMTKEKVVDLSSSTAILDEALFLKGAALEILEERKKIIASLKRSGIMCVECLPDSLTTDVINHYIQLKRKY